MSDLPPLTTAQKTELRSQARNIPGTLKVGKAGITPSLLNELRRLLSARELVKIRITAHDRDALEKLARQAALETGSHLITIVGHTSVFYLPKKSPQS